MTKLNPAQREAMRYVDGPLLVLAGAGSGKTRVIAQKVAYLIHKRGIQAEKIAAITFTNKAAQEMRGRIGQLLRGQRKDRPWISTFHTLGLKILHGYAGDLGYSKGFSIFDQRDCASLIADLARRESGSMELEANAMQRFISDWKAKLITPKAAVAEVGNEPAERLAATIYGPYCDALRTYNAVDFDDLIMLPVRLFQNHAEALTEWRARIAFLLVDEYQDTNATQYELIKLLVGTEGQLTAVGDDDQSIYGWRGAQPQNLVRLSEDFPALKIVKLEQNYRSMGVILKAANQLISNNPHIFDKKLWCDRGFGEKIRIRSAKDEHEEAELITNAIAHQRLLKGTKYGDFSILYRSNHQARVFEHALREREIPYRISGGRSFFDYTEIKDLVAYLRLLANPDADNALLRIINTPRRAIGPNTVALIVKAAAISKTSLFDTIMTREFEALGSPLAVKRSRAFHKDFEGLLRLAESQSPATLVKQLLQDIDYAAWIEQTSDTPKEAGRRQGNVNELVDWISRLEKKHDSLNDIVNALTLFDIMERQDADNDLDCVALMTLHAAKGLEFPHVYLVGFEEEILPHRNSTQAGTIDEERRLAYVGITRAEQTLSLSFARTRRRFGETLSCEPSRFIEELPQEDLAWDGQSCDDEANRDTGQATLAQLKQLLES